jgi:hypothetical protein
MVGAQVAFIEQAYCPWNLPDALRQLKTKSIKAQLNKIPMPEQR